NVPAQAPVARSAARCRCLHRCTTGPASVPSQERSVLRFPCSARERLLSKQDSPAPAQETACLRLYGRQHGRPAHRLSDVSSESADSPRSYHSGKSNSSCPYRGCSVSPGLPILRPSRRTLPYSRSIPASRSRDVSRNCPYSVMKSAKVWLRVICLKSAYLIFSVTVRP